MNKECERIYGVEIMNKTRYDSGGDFGGFGWIIHDKVKSGEN